MGADPTSEDRNPAFAGRRLIETYTALASRGEHLLGGLLEEQTPVQWQHYPGNDAIDLESGYQWFYHSHSPADRTGTTEHGHLHVFARRKLWSRRKQSQHERAFAEMLGSPDRQVNTRHLIGVGLDNKGVPASLFTVNSWVTGDLMLSARSTGRLLARLRLNTGNSLVDAVIEDVMTLCADEIREMLAHRDQVLVTRSRTGILEDRSLDVISEVPIDLDKKIAAIR